MNDLLSGWGDRVQEERLSLRMSRQELADRCSVSAVTIWRIEKGKLNPNDELKWKIAGVLGARMDRLWAWPTIVPPSPTAVAS